jgi:hypothetical protein
MLHDPLADAKGKIQAAMRGVSLLEVLSNTKCMKIVVEAKTMLLETAIQSPFAGMAKRRVPDVVNQSEGLGKVLIQPQRRRNGTGNLRDFDGVRQAGPKVVGRPRGENLRLAR